MGESGLWGAWLAASLWYGASVLRLTIAIPDDARINRLGMLRAFHRTIGELRVVLRRLSWLGALGVVLATLLAVTANGVATVSQCLEVVLASAAAIGLLLHVEPLAQADASRRLPPRNQIFTGLYALGATITLCLAARSIAQMIVHSTIPGPLWGVVAAGGALLGVALASAALVRPILKHESPQLEVILAIVSDRWSLSSAVLAGLVLLVVVLWTIFFASAPPSAAIALMLLAVLPVLGLLLLRVTALRRLWQSVRALPIAGMPSRTLSMRTLRARQRMLFLSGAAFACLVLSVSTSAPLLVLATTPHTSALAVHPGPTATSTPLPTPTVPAGALSATADGVRVTISDPHQPMGAATFHMNLTDAQGRALAAPSVMVALSPERVTNGGFTVAAVAGADGIAYQVPVTFTQPGAWDAVVVITSNDLAVAASVTFVLTVG